MSSDYISTSISTPIVETLACVAIVDKFGNVYGSLALAPGVTAELPGSISKRYLPSSISLISENYISAMEGFYGAGTARGVMGGNISLSQAGIISELNAGANAELSVEFGYTWYIGNINNNYYC